jgi:hypothetical protein
MFPGLLALAGGCILLALLALKLFPSSADEAFSWFSRLGFPDVAGRPYVKVTAGAWSSSLNDAPRSKSIEGFLLSRSNDTFTVLTKDLFVRSFKANLAEPLSHEQIRCEPLALRAEVTSYLELLRNPPKDPWRNFGERLKERSQIFVMAWACERNGYSVLARDLFDEAVKRSENVTIASNWWGRVTTAAEKLLNRPPKHFGMIEQLERDIGHAKMWRAVVDCGETNLSRLQLLGEFCDIVNKYPRSQHRDRAKEAVQCLTRMIAEDKLHPTLSDAELGNLPVQERVAELVFRLRDQNGHQISQPGWCDIFMDYRGNTNTAAHKLVRIGYPAVPQLIAALDDSTFTRSVGFHRGFYFSHTVLTVGDCASQILQRITGKSFYSPVTTSGYMSRDGKASPTRKAAQEWWAEFQKKGEKQILVEATERGDGESPAQARLLLDRYPADALAPITKGATNASGAWTRDELVQIVARLPGDAPVPFLSQEMVQSPFLQSSVAAAEALYGRGRSEAVTAMIAKWCDLRSTNVLSETSDIERLIRFLSDCDQPEAVDALGARMQELPAELRVFIVSAFAEYRAFSGATGGGFAPGTSKNRRPQPERSAGAVERLLVTCLEDTGQRMGFSGSWGDKSFRDPRVCDIAAHVLSQTWPAKYSFDLNDSLKERDRKRNECISAWRSFGNSLKTPQAVP